ncbi:hypothetical protein GQF01_02135 [Paenibacillus sp. 5J-6]|uniref:Uncharacterized protein n=1 Tax=Paenibacillus silvestris TaxID=2606219 RepID=A0A6L8UUW5_9BACL|nr:hypothetical protein [Paenibacillus silvestris]MZQ80939.1 hypothetical protein [Paenibacillus silvestris]
MFIITNMTVDHTDELARFTISGEGISKPAIPDLPILVLKPLTTVVGPEDPMLLPLGTE